MLTNSMIEKFAKRFQGLSKDKEDQKGNLKDAIDEAKSKEIFAKKMSSILKTDKMLKENQSRKKLSNQQNEQGQDQKQGQESIQNEFNQNKNNRKVGLARQNEDSEEGEGQIIETNRPGQRIKKKKMEVQISQDTPQEAPHESHGSYSKVFENNEKFYLKLKQKLMHAGDQQQKDQILKRYCKKKYRQKPSKAKVQFQAFNFYFQFKEQLKSQYPWPSQKQIQKKFSKKILLHLQKNIEEKKYKLVTICNTVFRGLNIAINQSANSWLSKLVDRNRHLLKGLNFQMYETGKRNGKQKYKTKFNSSKNQMKQVLSVSNDSVDESEQIISISPQSARRSPSKSIQEKYIKSKQLMFLLSSKNQIKSKPKPIPKKSSQQKPIPRITAKILQKQKQPDKKLPHQKLSQQSQHPNQKNQRFCQDSSSSILIKREKQNSSSEDWKSPEFALQYPEDFLKRIANKIDNIFKGLYKRIIDQQSQHLCLDKDLLIRIYQQHSQLQMKHLPEYLLQAQDISYKNFLSSKLQSDKKASYSSQPQPTPTPINAPAQTLNPKPQPLLPPSPPSLPPLPPLPRLAPFIPNPPAISVAQPQPQPYQQQPQLSPYDILRNELDIYRNSRKPCTAYDIKQEAIRIATAYPGVKSKISGSALAQWLYQYMHELEVKEFQQKVSNELNQISQAPRREIQRRQVKDISQPNSQLNNCPLDQILAKEFQKRMMTLYKNN